MSGVILLAVCTQAAQAQTTTDIAPPDERGYSYFLGIAQQAVTYREDSRSQPVKSEARSRSPLLITGALFALAPDTLVSLHSETTFFPGRSTERWTAIGTSLGGVTLTDPLVQSNGFSLSQSTNQLAVHQRVHKDFFATGGFNFHTQSFKRYSFVAGPDNAVTLPAGTTVEESTSELLLNLGVELESESVRSASRHYSLRASVGLPLWRRTMNTEAPDVRFTGAKGYDLEVEGRYSWAVLHSLQVGIWSKYAIARRSAESQSLAGHVYELPSNRSTSTALGVDVLWKY
ncbi:MAG: hypothetical protein IPG93_19255 [Burkholderiales bacterium]|nr:hypothetical protein [Burkholderiales bacterium]